MANSEKIAKVVTEVPDIIDDEQYMQELTSEEKKSVTRMYEDDILAGLIAAASYKDDPNEWVRINIKRPVADGEDAIVLSFRIRPMAEDEITEIRRKHTIYKRNKQVGTKVAESLDTPGFRAEYIYRATVDEDRQKIWDDRRAWARMSVGNGIGVIEMALKGGEKDAICDKIDQISAYNTDLDEKEKVKN